MTLLRLSPIALSRSRFAVSPLAETLSCLIALHHKRSEPWVARLLARHQADYWKWLDANEVASSLLPLLAATKWFPDYVAVPPLDGIRTRLADELAVVAAHTDEQITAMTAQALAASWRPCTTDWLRGGELASKIAAMLEEGWSRFIAPDWPERRTVLERDIMHRAGMLAAYGWQHAIRDMTPTSAWVDQNAILFSHQDYPDRWIDEDGLIFVPHTSGGGSWTCERPPYYALVYPAHGRAARHESESSSALSVLIGSGRACVLRELSQSATSTQLSRTLNLSLGTVSAHLAVLRNAGIVTRRRAGRNVIYHLTGKGESLLALLDSHP